MTYVILSRIWRKLKDTSFRYPYHCIVKIGLIIIKIYLRTTVWLKNGIWRNHTPEFKTKAFLSLFEKAIIGKGGVMGGDTLCFKIEVMQKIISNAFLITHTHINTQTPNHTHTNRQKQFQTEKTSARIYGNSNLLWELLFWNLSLIKSHI